MITEEEYIEICESNGLRKKPTTLYDAPEKNHISYSIGCGNVITRRMTNGKIYVWEDYITECGFARKQLTIGMVVCSKRIFEKKIKDIVHSYYLIEKQNKIKEIERKKNHIIKMLEV